MVFTDSPKITKTRPGKRYRPGNFGAVVPKQGAFTQNKTNGPGSPRRGGLGSIQFKT